MNAAVRSQHGRTRAHASSVPTLTAARSDSEILPVSRLMLGACVGVLDVLSPPGPGVVALRGAALAVVVFGFAFGLLVDIDVTAIVVEAVVVASVILLLALALVVERTDPVVVAATVVVAAVVVLVKVGCAVVGLVVVLVVAAVVVVVVVCVVFVVLVLVVLVVMVTVVSVVVVVVVVHTSARMHFTSSPWTHRCITGCMPWQQHRSW